MNNWLRRLLPFDKDKQVEIESQKSDILKEKEDTLKSLQKLNKRFRFTIESGQIEVIIKDITEIAKKK